MTSKLASPKSCEGTASLPEASMVGMPAWAAPSLNEIAPTVHWMLVPVPQPAASSTAPLNANVSPALSSLREGRTCRTAGSPGELQSGLGAAVTAGGGVAAAVVAAIVAVRAGAV